MSNNNNNNNNSGKKMLPRLSRRSLLSGLGNAALLSLASCVTGSFRILRLNGASDYDEYHSDEDLRKINFAYLNAADLRGNNDNIFKSVEMEEVLRRAEFLAKQMLKEKVDILCLSEVDYEDSIKTGCLNQPEIIAAFMGAPYNYVLFDEYMKSTVWTTGNAVISKFPMKAMHRHLYGETVHGEKGYYLDRVVHSYKDFIHAGIKIGRRELDAIVSHLSHVFPDLKMNEVSEILEYTTKLYRQNPDRFIIASGDCNDAHDSPPVKKLLSNGILHPPANFGLKTYPSDKPKDDLDHILTTENLRLNNYRTFDFPYSDHLGLICEMEFLE